MMRWFVKICLISIFIGIGWLVFSHREPWTRFFHDKNLSTNSIASHQLGEVKKGKIIVSVTAAGLVHSAKSTFISAPYNGYIKKVFVKVGDQIQIGDPLVSIAESALSKSGEIFPLRAPFKGTVAEVNIRQGEQVKANEGYDVRNNLIRIEDFSSFYIIGELPELDYVKVKKDLPAKIRVSAIIDQTFSGKVTELNLASKSQDRWDKNKIVFPIRVSMKEKDNRLKPGMSALIDIVISSKEETLLLEHEFIEKNESKYYVTLENGQKAHVKLGLQNEIVAEILDGLVEHQKVRQVDFLAGDSSL